MKYEVSQSLISLTWDICSSKIYHDLPFPVIILNKTQFRKKCDDHKILIKVFEQQIVEINEFLEGNYVFFITNPEAIVLSVIINKKIKDHSCLQESVVIKGISMAEESMGTNAISLAMRLKQPVLVRPEQHFCNLMSTWYEICFPLYLNGNVTGYFEIGSIDKPFSRELIVLAELIAFKLEQTLYNYNLETQSVEQLSDIQLHILHLLSFGVTEKEIAGKVHLSVNTIKYHKKKIFKKLKVQNTAEAAAKAIKLKLFQSNI